MQENSNKHTDFNQFINLSIRQNLSIWEVSVDLLMLERMTVEKNDHQKRIKELDRKLANEGLWKNLIGFFQSLKEKLKPLPKHLRSFLFSNT